MSDAPERVVVRAYKFGELFVTTPDKVWPYKDAAATEAEYVRADLASAGVRRAEALAEAESDLLTTAQARIAELEAALEHIAGAVPSFDYVQAAYDAEGKLDMSQPGSPYDRGKAEAYRTLNEFARRALEAKP